MSWASHPTSQMPAMPPHEVGRHRRRRRNTLAVAGAAGALALIVAGAMFSPTLVGWPPPSQPAAAGAPHAGGGVAPTTTAASTPTATPTPTPTPPPTTAAAPTTRPPSGFEAMENSVITMTNAERAKSGCAALRLDTRLRSAARNYSVYMAQTGTFEHGDPGARLKAAGYDISRGWAENIAKGYPTADAVMKGWMASSGHRANILNCTWKAIGVGVARAGNGQLYWTQDFGGR